MVGMPNITVHTVDTGTIYMGLYPYYQWFEINFGGHICTGIVQVGEICTNVYPFWYVISEINQSYCFNHKTYLL